MKRLKGNASSRRTQLHPSVSAPFFLFLSSSSFSALLFSMVSRYIFSILFSTELERSSLQRAEADLLLPSSSPSSSPASSHPPQCSSKQTHGAPAPSPPIQRIYEYMLTLSSFWFCSWWSSRTERRSTDILFRATTL